MTPKTLKRVKRVTYHTVMVIQRTSTAASRYFLFPERLRDGDGGCCGWRTGFFNAITSRIV